MKYDDATASGHTAVMAQEDTQKEDNVKLIIGNLMPNQEVTVHLQLINILKVKAGAYCFKVPV